MQGPRRSIGYGIPPVTVDMPRRNACALAGTVVSAKQKRIVRCELLQQAGIATTPLRNIDAIDAALCALTAGRLLAPGCSIAPCGRHVTVAQSYTERETPARVLGNEVSQHGQAARIDRWVPVYKNVAA